MQGIALRKHDNFCFQCMFWRKKNVFWRYLLMMCTLYLWFSLVNHIWWLVWNLWCSPTYALTFSIMAIRIFSLCAHIFRYVTCQYAYVFISYCREHSLENRMHLLSKGMLYILSRAIPISSKMLESRLTSFVNNINYSSSLSCTRLYSSSLLLTSSVPILF